MDVKKEIITFFAFCSGIALVFVVILGMVKLVKPASAVQQEINNLFKKEKQGKREKVKKSFPFQTAREAKR